MRRLALIPLVLALVGALASAQPASAARRARAAPSRPVVVELFTAQGCTACPQANALLQELAGRKGVLALTFPVDIWDYLGWSDTFAKPEFTDRQRAYIGKLKLREIYTPEIIVAGRKETIGFDREKVNSLVKAEAARRDRAPTLRFLSATRVEVGPGGGGGGGGGEVWLARFDPQEKTVKVTTGENRGKTVVQQNVVRELARLGPWSGRMKRFTLPAPSAEGLKTAVIMQGAKGGPVLAAAVK